MGLFLVFVSLKPFGCGLYNMQINIKHYKNLTPGLIYRFHTNSELIPHVEGYKYKVKWLSGGSATVSDKGNKFITKIAICPYCGELRQSTQLKKATCKKCAKLEPKKKAGKTAKETAYAITGDYPRQKRGVYVEPSWDDIFMEIEIGMA